VDKNLYKRESNPQDWIESRTIYKVISGSHAYGLNTENSDIDIRGVCVPPRSYIVGMRNFEQYEEKKPNDLTIYGIHKFFKLASDCNPNIIELLFITDPKLILLNSKYWDKVVKNRHLFLSQRAKHTYSGYAYSQLRRIKTHRSWLLNPPTKQPDRSDFGLDEEILLTEDLTGAVESLPKSVREEIPPYLMKLYNKERQYLNALKHWNQYQSWKKNRNPERAELERKYGYDCYSSDTEFLTNTGWKLFDHVTAEDRLATMDLKTEGLEYQNYVERHDAFYSGNMYQFEGHHIDTFVSANHRMLVRRVEKNTRKRHDWVFKPAGLLTNCFDVYRGIKPKIRNFCDSEIVSKYTKLSGLTIQNYLRLMGYYLSDGTLNKESKEGGYRAIRISQKRGGRLNNLMGRLKNFNPQLGIKRYEYERKPNKFKDYGGKEVVWILHNSEIATTFLKECGHGSNNKRIPRWVYNLSKRNMDVLIEAMLKGDGTKRNTNFETDIYCTSSSQLADDVQELSFLCGYVTAKWGPYEASRSDYKDNDQYRVHIDRTCSKRKSVKGLESGYPIVKELDRSKNVKKVPVKNYRVVCFTVPNEILITRRNGKISIHGNTKHASHIFRLIIQGHQILTQGSLNVELDAVDKVFINAIKTGDLAYDEMIERAEVDIKVLETMNEGFAVPYSTDKVKIDFLLMEIVEECLVDGI
jgi:predicted nucleotidyltransferase